MCKIIFIVPYFICSIIWGQKHFSPYSYDSVFISGKVVDELGVPIENAMVLFSPYYRKSYDITWYHQDTFYTNNNGRFLVECTKAQIENNYLYFKKGNYLTTRLIT